jgi:2-dehydropantoate 2-reductase
MRVIIHGVGAVGGAIAAALVEAGTEVVGIARGAQLDALRAGPLKLRMPGGDISAPVPVVAAPEEIAFRPDDAVLLTMKSQDTAAALAALRAAGLTDQPLFCFQNGIANEDLALRLFPNVHGVTVMMPVSFLRPAEIVANGAPKQGLFDIGRYPSGADADDHALAALFEGPRLGGFVHEDVMASKRGKLLLNVSNAIDAAIGQEFRQGDLAKRARAEAEAAFRAAGMTWQEVGLDDPRRKDLMQMQPVPGAERGGSSTTQSLTRKTGSVETDYLNGEIARLGRLHGVDTPVNAALTRLAARMAREGLSPGSFTRDTLEAAVAAGG